MAKAEQQPNNQIWYRSTKQQVVTPYNTDFPNITIISNEYDTINDQGIITFNGDVTTIIENAFN